MRKILLLSLIVSFALASHAQADTWKTYSSREGHYSIAFPTMPKETVEYDSTSANILKIHFATCESGDNSVLMAGWIDMSAITVPEKPIKELLEASRDGATASMKATKVTTTALNLTGEPYIEFAFSSDGFEGKDRIYYINKVQYSLIAIYGPNEPIKSQVDKFIGSFKYIR